MPRRVPTSAWYSAALSTLHLLRPPLPGSSELQDGVTRLLSDAKSPSYIDAQFVLLLKRIDRLINIASGSSKLQYSGTIEQLRNIKERFNDKYNRSYRLSGTSEALQKQYLLEEAHEEISRLVEQTQLQIILECSSTGRGPVDNRFQFPTVQAHEIVERKLCKGWTWQGNSESQKPGAIGARCYRARLGHLSVIYMTYQAPQGFTKTSKFVELELERLSNIMHENVASVVGITKGYGGINGIVMTGSWELVLDNPCCLPQRQVHTAGGTPLGIKVIAARLKQLQGIQSGAECDPSPHSRPAYFNEHEIAYMNILNEIVVRPDGHAIIYFSPVDSGRIEGAERICSYTMRDSRQTMHPAASLVIDALANHRNFSSNRHKFINRIATLGRTRFMEMQVSRIAAECKLLPSTEVRCQWRTVNRHPPFTIGLGDIGLLVKPKPWAVGYHWEFGSSREVIMSPWDPIHEAPYIIAPQSALYLTPGAHPILTDKRIVSEGGWHSQLIPNLPNQRKVHIGYDWSESPHPFDEYAIKQRLSVVSMGEMVSLHYCSSAEYMVTIEHSWSSQGINQPLYFHCNHSFRSDPRAFWGFVSTSSNPYAKETGIERFEIKLFYEVHYKTYPIEEMWLSKYERMLRSGLASIPGAYPALYP
ncbi:hypothetical protein RhiJN_04768 [Ceratobasidium sp. AG-Ba]|nr:hypothetical protein RhiJN_04768 [Ceratobasidium sp. AG-Ba]